VWAFDDEARSASCETQIIKRSTKEINVTSQEESSVILKSDQVSNDFKQRLN
jgi:hypothetical protein